MFSLFKNINRYAGRWKILDMFARFCARYLIYLMIIFLFVFYFLRGNFQVFIYCFASGLLGTFVIARLIYLFFKEHRPAEFSGTKVLIPVPKNPSFPSSHASFLFGLSLLIIFYDLRLAIIFILLSCIVGVARVFCGVHWFRDIIGGLVAGILSSAIIYYLLIYAHI